MPNNILLFLAEQISLILFYYVQDILEKPVGNKVDKRQSVELGGSGGTVSPLAQMHKKII